MKKTKDEYIHLRITPEKKKMLEGFAEAEGRSLSNYLETAGLERGIQNKKARDRFEAIKHKLSTVKK